MIAPAAPHALHMPSHIFTRLGLWQESVATNGRSAIAAEAGHEPIQALHAMDFVVYADLQLARDGDARATIDAASRVKGPAVLTGSYALAVMPARYALERGAYSETAELQPSEGGGPVGQALTYYARALGAARSGGPASAQTDLRQIVMLHDALARRRTPTGRPKSTSCACRPRPGSRSRNEEAMRRSASCAGPPTSKTRARRAP